MLDSPIEEIKSKVDIVEFLADYIQLKKAGTNYKAVCPFHNEKTPSFMVSPSKQIWHCFGCGLGGDVFEFVKQMENVEFGEALKILADRTGVELKKPTAEQVQIGQKKDVLYEINSAAAKYFEKVLWESEAGKPALEYLKARGLTDQTIKNWQLGFAPDDFHYLENFLAKNFNKLDAVLAGLTIKKDDGTFFDRFHGRIMFPILNLHGQTVGFTGRLLKEDPNAGKYINSPETPIYSKSQVVYGLYQAKNAIRKENRAILVEGNMDVISAHQAGSTNVVGTSGTALTKFQSTALGRLTENLIFAFDADAAGNNTNRKALEWALDSGFDVKIVDFGSAKDPDELIKKGIGLWKKALDSAPNGVEFFFQQALKEFDPHTVDGVTQIKKQMLPLLAKISSDIVKAHFIRKLSRELDVSETSILDELKKNRPAIVQEPASAVPAANKSRKQLLEEELLGLCLFLNQTDYLKTFDEADFDSEYRNIIKESKTTGPSQLKSHFPEIIGIMNRLEFIGQIDIEEKKLNPSVELPNLVSELKKIIKHDRRKELEKAIKTAEKENNQELLKKLTQEHISLN
ncbi:MAG TPA: DNA primase [Patescibacteria group bacterium]|jgi:DNA primase|nr:DNA primase [Patescibacteria group bacterium]